MRSIAATWSEAEELRGRVLISFDQARRIEERVGPSFYLLEPQRIDDNYRLLTETLTAAYADTRLAYSFKTNYTPAVCAQLKRLGCLAEVVSEMEFEMATRLGYRGQEIIVNGPVHSELFVERSLLSGAMLNLGSWYLLDAVAAVAHRHPTRELRVGARLNFEIEGGGETRFGFDVEDAAMARLAAWAGALRNVRIVGLHCHFSNAKRTVESFVSRSDGLLAAADRYFQDADLEVLNIGGGFSGNMPDSLAAQHEGDTTSFEEYGRATARRIAQRYPRAPRPRLVVEPGTALVGDAMELVARVIDVKTIRGRELVLVDASNHNIRHRWKPDVRLPFSVIANPEGRDGAVVGYDVVGNTCIELDVLVRDGRIPVRRGDYLRFPFVGGYSHVLKGPFMHPCQPIVVNEPDGPRVVKRRQTVDEILESYVTTDGAESGTKGDHVDA